VQAIGESEAGGDTLAGPVGGAVRDVSGAEERREVMTLWKRSAG